MKKILFLGIFLALSYRSLHGMAVTLSYDQRRNRVISELLQQYEWTLNNILQRAILKDGRVDKAQLNRLLELIRVINEDANLTLSTRNDLTQKIKIIYEQAPMASKVLMSGYNDPYFKDMLRFLSTRKSFYAQPLIDLERKNWEAAQGIATGFPKGYPISNPSPFDADYEQLVSDYIGYSDRLENMGYQPILEELKKLASDFNAKFDQMLMVNDIGKAKKKQLIEWLGGPQNYLTYIFKQKINEAEIVRRTITMAREEQKCYQ